MQNNEKLNKIVNGLFIRGRKLNISLFLSRRKDVRLDTTHFFIMEIPNKRELELISYNHSSYIDSKYIMNLYKQCTGKSFSFLLIDATLSSDNRFRFRKNLAERI